MADTLPKIITAKTAGFCFGVKNALETVYKTIDSFAIPVYTYGPIIHNELVIGSLEQKGIGVITNLEELDNIGNAAVIIRSHGVSRREWELLHRDGVICIDATCPFVKKIHTTVDEESRNGAVIIIAGDPEHPEVKGIRGWVNAECHVVNSPLDVAVLPRYDGRRKVFVAQTTFDSNKFQELVEIFKKMNYNILIKNTVCSATKERQAEALEIAQLVDAMFVIGDRHSSNTRKLYEICKSKCKCTYFTQTLLDLEDQPFHSYRHVGITAGASTPKNIIEEVQNYVRSKF